MYLLDTLSIDKLRVMLMAQSRLDQKGLALPRSGSIALPVRFTVALLTTAIKNRCIRSLA